MSRPYLDDSSSAYQEFPFQQTSYQEPSSPGLPYQQPSSPQPAYQPSRYPQPPFGGWMIQPVVVPSQVNEKAIVSMVLGLGFAAISCALLVGRSTVFFTLPRLLVLGLGVYPLVVGIPAVTLGHLALKQMNNSNGRLRGQRMAITGLILGYLAIVVEVVAVAVVLLRPDLLPPQ